MECGHAYAYKGAPQTKISILCLWDVHTLFTGQRERERERERVRKREREREKCRICPELLFLFSKGMMGAMAPFIYLVFNRQKGFSEN